MTKGWLLKLLVMLMALGVPAGALAQEAESSDAGEASAEGEGDDDAVDASVSAEEGDEEVDPRCQNIATAPPAIQALCAGEEARRWNVGLSGSISAGIGSFVANEFARRTRVRYGINMNASYQVPSWEKGKTLFIASIGTGFSQWLSTAGGSQTVQEFRWGDGWLNLSKQIYTIPGIDVGIGANLSFTLPISVFSRTAGLYTTISPSLNFQRAFFGGALFMVYSIGYNHNFYESTSVTYNPSEVDILSRRGGAEVTAEDSIAAGGVLPEMSLSNSFSIIYSFLGQFQLAVGLGFSDSWTHDQGTISSGDEYTPQTRDTDGNLVADVGRGHRQGVSGRISFNYAPLPFLSVGLTLASSQPWRTADNKGFRFPFFDFESTANNFTWMGLGVSGRY